MGIHTRMDKLMVRDRRRLADDLLSRVIADHTAARLQQVQVINQGLVGLAVPYTVTVNGVTSTGVGELLAPQVRTAVRDVVVRSTTTVPAVRIAFTFLFTAVMLAQLVKGLRRRDSEDDPLVWIARRLRERSPVLSGAYRDSHILFADQREAGDVNAVIGGADIPTADEYSFANSLPYARKIEIGKTQDGRDFVISVPNRIYERTARDATARFRGVAEIRYEMRAIIGSTQTPQSSARRQHNRPAVRYPTIIIRYR